MESDFFTGNGELLMAANAAAVVLAQGRSKEEITRMAAFFTIIGDALALLALPDQPSK